MRSSTGFATSHRAAGSTSSAATGPLSGIRITERGSLIVGPFATRLLADFGADVTVLGGMLGIPAAEVHDQDIGLDGLTAVARWLADRLGHPLPGIPRSAGGLVREVVA